LTREEFAATKPYDYCCNPAHSWMLEEKMKLEWGYRFEMQPLLPMAVRCFPFKDFENWQDYPVISGANRLHATALAAWEAVKND
jgi:hypothetical protein